MNKVIGLKEAVKKIESGMTLMVGGFIGCGNPHRIISALANSDVTDLTLICNDGSIIDQEGSCYGVAKLIANHQVKKIIASHVGTNREVARQMNAGTLELILVPQGSLVEMIRAGGSGLGGVLTPTGVGTIVEEAEHVHSRIEISGKQYLLEKPLVADFALISGYQVDFFGNTWYKGTTRNFNEVMALAGHQVIVEADHLVPIGSIPPEDIRTPGVLVDYIVEGGSFNE
ncbi:acetate CoA/acetoacetate CoA-transferase alpha subunit [Enterococcus sp. PF1-24]|uniref:CoA transferase subunit A n=1 Tax=unclassified Enterococcus TaxID=2608891 RepID=UPI002474A702|nr:MULTISPECIES: 3-oxoacid CoA-transferase subunit A [unclassified Enterococcus]MDH6364759.1 acetate CoA/acetoacetate CoA-transferase alpha subunit [Enterococcus sp. PFB1-1]MDH6401896.1 acetate CoA/acetoacetate CoA-transferase alpha subunit [Enterococcus sp. PF1-24]